MQAEPLGKVLPRILLPYIQQWAERSGMTLLSRLLVDEQFRGVLERYGDELVTRMAQAAPPVADGNGRANGSKPTPRSESTPGDGASVDLMSLQDRVLAMEAQQETQQALFELVRNRIRPLALALGCCSDCVVGVEGCPKCRGRSSVGLYPPDYTALETQIVRPLAARGVPLVLHGRKVPGDGPSRQSTATKKRSRAWPTR